MRDYELNEKISKNPLSRNSFSLGKKGKTQTFHKVFKNTNFKSLMVFCLFSLFFGQFLQLPLMMGFWLCIR